MHFIVYVIYIILSYIYTNYIDMNYSWIYLLLLYHLFGEFIEIKGAVFVMIDADFSITCLLWMFQLALDIYGPNSQVSVRTAAKATVTQLLSTITEKLQAKQMTQKVTTTGQ